VQKILPPEALIKAIRQGGRGLPPGAERGGAAQPRRAAEDLQRQAATLGVPHCVMADGSLDSYASSRPPGANTESTAAASELEADRQALGRATQGQTGGADDHFFLLGGNSIAATQVIARCAKNWAWS
jgi:hypothetical protein